MKQVIISLAILILSCIPIFSQAQSSDSATFWKPIPRNYNVKQAFEVESLFPMFLYGGWHLGVGYRYKKFRARFSVINGGSYNADVQAIDGVIDGFERYYTTSPGIFLGYNVWKNLEVYSYYERHTFEIKQIATNETGEIASNDFGIGLSYQFFIGRTFYIMPGVHTYWRPNNSVSFSNSQNYNIPTFELTPIVRIGARLWKQFD